MSLSETHNQHNLHFLKTTQSSLFKIVVMAFQKVASKSLMYENGCIHYISSCGLLLNRYKFCIYMHTMCWAYHPLIIVQKFHEPSSLSNIYIYQLVMSTSLQSDTDIKHALDLEHTIISICLKHARTSESIMPLYGSLIIWFGVMWNQIFFNF